MMKRICIGILLVSHFIISYSQDINFEIKNTYSRPVNKELLIEAKSFTDINPGYPSSWISDYISSEVVVISNGKTINTLGTCDKFTNEQMDILKSADPGTDINVEVKYKSLNSINNKVDHNVMKFAVSLVPQYEAEFPGGKDQLKTYLKEKAILKIKDTKLSTQAIVKFIVNENGEISHVKIAQSSQDEKLDQLLLITIANMPRWKPATDKNGVKVKQELVFSVGNPGC